MASPDSVLRRTQAFGNTLSVASSALFKEVVRRGFCVILGIAFDFALSTFLPPLALPFLTLLTTMAFAFDDPSAVDPRDVPLADDACVDSSMNATL